MAIKATEISDLIKQRIESYEGKIELKEVGYVISVGDGVARVYTPKDFEINRMMGDIVEPRRRKAARCEFFERGIEDAGGIAQQALGVVERQRLHKSLRRQPGPAAE